MGCHTWYSKRVERSEEEARNFAIENILEQIESAKDGQRNPEENHPDIDYVHWQKWAERVLRMLRNGLLTGAMWRLQPERPSAYVNGKYWVVIDEFHDGFRTDYNDTWLFSLEETLKYIEDNDEHIYYNDVWNDKTAKQILKEKKLKRVFEFWEKYPNGSIHFG